jgi:hypothetical protein
LFSKWNSFPLKIRARLRLRIRRKNNFPDSFFKASGGAARVAPLS